MRKGLILWDGMFLAVVASIGIYIAFQNPSNTAMAIGILCLLIMGACLCKSTIDR